MHPFRTHTCGALRKTDAGQVVRLSGWICRKRDHGQLLFLDLRDHYGVTQIVADPASSCFDTASKLRLETVVTVTGRVVERAPETVNPNLATGEIEVQAETIEIQGPCDPLPFPIAGTEEEAGPEETRLRYRYLDLRRERLHRNIVLRSDVIALIRRRMQALGFREYQTPILTSSSPEGARDFLVPSRLHPGRFYALPQAPQQFKQLLMIAGFDRYFQIAPCFRDEDARADRSPGEFYQLDIEMSYVTQDDIFAVVEEVLSEVFSTFSTWKQDKPPFRRISYDDALVRYGTDKPDLRNPIEIRDVSDLFRQTSFKVFRSVLDRGGVVRAIPVSDLAAQPRSFFDRMVEYAQSLGAGGLAYLVWSAEGVKGPPAKFMTSAEIQGVVERTGARTGDVVFFVCDQERKANRWAGEIRTKLGRDLDRIEKETYRFCWIVDFPMFERDEETGQIVFSHNPFSMPQGGMEALMTRDPLTVKAFQYDVVCNGVELSSGAIRNHSQEIMVKAFEIAGYTREDVEQKFPALFNAFRYGAPPHGGIAPGIDRIVMLLAGESNIREVIAFPLNQRAQDLMMGAPSPVTERQLRELHIRLALPPKPTTSTS